MKILEEYYKRKSVLNEEEKANTLLLFKSGIFYTLVQDDAIICSKILNLKLTSTSNGNVKVGFPINSLPKYLDLLERNGKREYKFLEITELEKDINVIKNMKVDKEDDATLMLRILKVLKDIDLGKDSIIAVLAKISKMKQYFEDMSSVS